MRPVAPLSCVFAALLLSACGSADLHQRDSSKPDAVGQNEGAVSCGARVDAYPVRGPHRGGWAPNMTFSCPGHVDSSDYYTGAGDANHQNGHLGNDLFGARGTPIVAARAGRISYAGTDSIGGRNVEITDDCGWTHYYAHMDTVAAGLWVGQRVSAGTMIGTMGDTGQALGGPVHLHYSVFPDGNYWRGIDPFPLLEQVDHTSCAAQVAKVPSGGTGGATKFVGGGRWLTGFGMPDWAAAGDFNGDGKDDLAWYEGWNGGALTIALSDGQSLVPAGKWATGFGRPDFAATGDFNGDGKSDLVWYEAWNNHGMTVLLSTGSGFHFAGKWASGWGQPDWAGVGDFNGDGKSDIAWYEQWKNHTVSVGLSTGGAFAGASGWVSGWGGPDFATTGDFDGDGKSDLAWFEAWNNGSTTVGLSTGSGVAHRGKWLSGFGAPDVALVGDFNNDARDDLAWFEAWNQGSVTVALSQGSGFAHSGKWLSSWGAPDFAAAGDFDGDGRDDLAWYHLWDDGSVSVALAR